MADKNTGLGFLNMEVHTNFPSQTGTFCEIVPVIMVTSYLLPTPSTVFSFHVAS